jgi:hypothetical protein
VDERVACGLCGLRRRPCGRFVKKPSFFLDETDFFTPLCLSRAKENF